MRAPALCLLLLAAGCADIDRFAPDTCGNLVIEAGEDCDTFAEPELGEGLVCGAPDGAPTACRYVCGDDAGCPDGWSCFDDGVCRYPSGTYALDDDPVAILRADQIELADVVGDDPTELVRRIGGELSVLDLAADDDEALTVQQATFTALRGPPALARLDPEDPRSAIFAIDTTGFADPEAQPRLHVLRDAAGHLGAAVAPSVDLDGAAEVVAAARVPGDDGDDLLLLVEEGSGVRLGLRRPACAAERSEILPGAGPWASPAVAPQHGAAVRVAVAAVGSRSVFSVTATRAEDGCLRFSAPRTVALPGPLSAAGLSLLDLEGDGSIELLAYLEEERVALARAGTSSATISPALLAIDTRPEHLETACNGERLVLVAGDIDGDGRADFVTEDAIFLGTQGGLRRVFARDEGDAWAEAALADIDGDGDLDVVATTRAESADCSPADLQLLRQVRPGAFVARPVPEATSPRHLQAGDFDGDGIGDIATVQEGEDGTHRVTVFFGDAKESLEDFVFVAGLPDVAAMHALVSRPSAGPNSDPVSDLVVRLADDPTQAVFLFGDPTRILRGPVSFETPNTGVGFDAWAVTAGPLTGSASALPDVLVLGPNRAWLGRGEALAGGGGLEALTVDVGEFAPTCALYAAAVDADEPTVFAVDGAAPRGLASAVVDGCADRPSRIAALRVRDDRLEVVTAPAPEGVGAPRAIVRADLDDAGEADVAYVFEGRDGGPGRLYVALGGGVAGALTRVMPERDVWAAAALDADADPTRELAVLTADGLFVVDFADGRAEVSPTPSAEVPDRDPDEGLVALRAGEIDGDGLPDLVLLLGEGLFRLTARPHR